MMQALSLRMRHAWMEPLAILAIAVTVVLGILVLYPAGLLVLGSLGHALSGASGSGWIKLIHEPRLLSALGNTLALTLAYVGISMPIAIGISWLIARTDLPAGKWLEFGFWLSFFLPPLAVVQGWILMLDPSFGVINSAWQALFGRPGPFDIFSWWGIVFAHLVTTAVSAKVMLMTPAFRNLDGAIEEAAMVAGDRVLSMLRRIVVPVMAPTLLVTLVLSIVKSLESFEIELVLGTPKRIDVYSTQIYRLIRSDPPEFSAAAAMGVTMIAAMLLLAAVQRRMVAKRVYATLGGKPQGRLLPLGGARWPLFALVCTVLVILVALPIASLVASTFMTMYGYFQIAEPWTLAHWREVIGDAVFVDSLFNTLRLALGVALFAMTVGFLVAYLLTYVQGRWARALDTVSWIPVSMPGVLFSMAWLGMMLSLPWLQPLYGTTMALVLIIGLATLTMSAQLIRGALGQLSLELAEASTLSGATRLSTVARILLPLVLQSVLVTGVVGFISAGRNIGHIALLVTSDNRPLSIMQLEFLSEGRYEAASVVGVIVVALTAIVAIVARAFGLRAGPRA
ncbi:MAG: iron ABC transporter permease [Burkholderiales bacterium]|nr:iron ABC transporter permease [Burkholderiales bacterium]